MSGQRYFVLCFLSFMFHIIVDKYFYFLTQDIILTPTYVRAGKFHYLSVSGTVYNRLHGNIYLTIDAIFPIIHRQGREIISMREYFPDCPVHRIVPRVTKTAQYSLSE